MSNKGACGVDRMSVEELGEYLRENQETIIKSLRNRIYMPNQCEEYIYQKAMESKGHLEYR